MEAPTKEEGPGRDRGTSSSPSKNSLAQHDPAPDRWRDGWHRRCIRASVDERYYELMPLGVQLAANAIRARMGGDAE